MAGGDGSLDLGGYARSIEPVIQTNVWMPLNSWSKQNCPPPIIVPEALVANPHVVLTCWLPRPMNMYPPLTLQLLANAHSMPPPSVPVMMVLEFEEGGV
jgi:hypothetical protein